MNKQPRSEAFRQMFGTLSEADIKAGKLKFKVAKAIYRKRKELKLTQAEFAEKLKVSQSMVSKWETFDYNFSIEAMAALFDALDMDLDIRTGPEVQDYFNLTVTHTCNDGWFYQARGKRQHISAAGAHLQEVIA